MVQNRKGDMQRTMKRTLKYALTAVLGVALVIPAAAQSNFPDVPETHWAYKELARLKADGLLVGYPDGLFRGGRPASRYEMAVAIHALYMRMKGVTDGLKGQIDDIMAKLETKADKADLDNLRAAVDALRASQVKPEDLAALKKLIEEFRGELSALGADVAKMKQSLADLDDRVSDLEKALPVAISGDLNFVINTSYSQSGRQNITVDGRPSGFQGPLKNFSVFHEAAVTLKNRTKGALNWGGTVVFGNTMNGLGNQSRTLVGAPYAEGPTAAYIQNFGVDFSSKILGLGFNAKVGRIGYQVSPLIFKRPDTTPYYSNNRWDNGDHTFDGALLDFGYGGGVSFKIFGGKTGTQNTSGGGAFQRLNVGPNTTFAAGGAFNAYPYGQGNLLLNINQFVGAQAKLGFGSADLNFAYLFLNSDTTVGFPNVAGGVDGAAVYGVDVKVPLGAFDLSAAYAQSDLLMGKSSRINEDNSAWYANLGYNTGNLSAKVGYKSILPQFGAPGDWGRIGTWYNPTDIEGFTAGLNFKVSDALSLAASGEFYKGSDTTIAGAKGLTSKDKIDRFLVDANYQVNPAFGLNLGWERVNVKFAGQGKPYQQWFNIGTNWNITNKSKLSFMWQISDVSQKELPGNPKFKGGLLTTQLSIKF